MRRVEYDFVCEKHDYDGDGPCDACGRNEARADERRNIVDALRRKARAHERLSGLRCSPALRQWWDWDLARYHEGAADALETMADRIERGDV